VEWPKRKPTDSPSVDPTDEARATKTGLYKAPPIPVATIPGAGKKRVEEETKLKIATPKIPKDFKVSKSNLKYNGEKRSSAETRKRIA